MSDTPDGGRRGLEGGVGCGGDYTPAECEFLKAVDAWRRAHRRPFPAATDYLKIAASLGYARPDPQPTERT